MTDERWLPIEGELGYEVSDYGQVRSYVKPGGSARCGFYDKPKLLKTRRAAVGGSRLHGTVYYQQVSLRTRRNAQVHRVVLETFQGPCPDGMVCRHLDGNPHNNRLDNLAWGTMLENSQDRFRHGTATPAKQLEPINFFDPFIPIEAILPFEVWKEVPGYLGYDVSNFGRVQSRWTRGPHANPSANPRIINPIFQNDKIHRYPSVRIRSGVNSMKAFDIHRIVMMTFNPRPSPELACRHLDSNPQNNHLSNLRWGTSAENGHDRILRGTTNAGERHWQSKLTADQVRLIRIRIANGELSARLADEFGVSKGAISLIRTRKNWRNLP